MSGPRITRTSRYAAVLPLLAAALALGACGDGSAQPLMPASHSTIRQDKKVTSPTKFEFFGETVTDADGTVFTDVTIRATSKLTGSGSGDTVCGYFTADETYLGQFEALEWVASGDIEQYCINHFADRQV